MSKYRSFGIVVLLAVAFLGTEVAFVRTAVAQSFDREGIVAGVQIQTRGPVHEAFAAMVRFDRSPGIALTIAPPDPIQEVPPDEMLEGENVAWISGYWSWDDDRDDFLWISGIWRVVPPGRQWVPGYWSQTAYGYQWVPGFWRDADVQEIEYLPEPPESIEVAPPGPPPSPNHIWVEGNWIWSGRRYLWRPGYWIPVNPYWTWVPGHYMATPCGYVFVDSYWDHRLRHRGVLFAPVYYQRPVYRQRAYFYSPRIAIDVTVLTDNLFVRADYHHYYFGDYYGERYADMGIRPWFATRTGSYGYDPIYADFRWRRLREDPQWEYHTITQYRYRSEHEEARPPHTFEAQAKLVARVGAAQPPGLIIAKTLPQLAENKVVPIRLKTLDEKQRKEIIVVEQEVHKFQTERRKVESESAAKKLETPSKAPPPFKMKLPASPVVAKPLDKIKATPPPAKPDIPKPDTTIQPKPKKEETKPGAPTGPPKPKIVGPKPGQPKGTPQPPTVGPKPGQPKGKPQPPTIGPKPEKLAGEPKPTPTGLKPTKPKGKPKPPAVGPKPAKVKPKPTRPAGEPEPPAIGEKPGRPGGESKPSKLGPPPDQPKGESKPPKGKLKPAPAKGESKPPKGELSPDQSKDESKPPKGDAAPKP